MYKKNKRKEKDYCKGCSFRADEELILRQKMTDPFHCYSLSVIWLFLS